MVEYDPFDDEIIHGDPHLIYQRLRDESPVHYIEKWNTWALSRFQDIWEACSDTETYTAATGTTSAHLMTKVQPVTPMLNTMDPPDHTRLRAEMRKFFMPAQLKSLRPEIERIIESSIMKWESRGECDVVTEFAQEVATQVGCLVAGFPQEDGRTLGNLVDRFMARDPDIDGVSPDGLAALDEIYAYFEELSAARRRQTARLDPIGILQSFEVAGRKLTDGEVGSHLFLLLVGGTDTFPKVFANLLLRLHESPDVRRSVARDPALALPAFNEAVRIDMPTQFMARALKRDISIHGKRLYEGQVAIFLYASGNRDEREFSSPGSFRLDRAAPRALSFGHGTHACIGLHVARLEGCIALTKLLEKFPHYEIDLGGLERYATEFVQGYSAMPIRWQP